jgi:hypothetical protein
VIKKLLFFFILLVSLPIVFSAAPTVTSSISPTPAFYNTTLFGYCQGSDDGSVLGYYYNLYKNGILNSSGSLVGSNTTRGAFVGQWSMIVNRSWAGVTTDGSYLYYVSEPSGGENSKVFKYNYNGAYTGTNFSLSASSTNRSFGIEYFNGYLYIVDGDDFLNNNFYVYQYYTNGTYTGWNIYLEKTAGFQAWGIAAYDTSKFYIVEAKASGDLIEYLWNGSRTGTKIQTNNVSQFFNFYNAEFFNDRLYILGTVFPATDSRIAEYIYNGTTWVYSSIVSTPGITATNPYVFTLEGSQQRFYLLNGTTSDTTTTYYLFDHALPYFPGSNINVANVSTSLLNATDIWTLECRSYDGMFNSTPNNATKYINDYVPTVASVNIMNTTIYSDTDVYGNCSGQTPTNNTLTYYYKWYVNNIDVGVSSTILPSSYIVKNDNVTFNCMVADGAINSSRVNSSIKTVSGRVPQWTQGNLSYNLSHYYNISLQLNATDLDNNTISYSTNSSNFTITSSGLLLKNNTIFSSGIYNISVNASDSDGYTIMWLYFNITNTFPTVSITIYPVAADAGATLNCTNSTIDVDNDAITSWSLRWFVNGVYNSTFNNQTIINGSYVFLNQAWVCSILANDALGNNGYINSTPMVIGDSIAPTLLNDAISSTSGVNNAPFTIYIDVLETNFINSVIVQINDPNSIKTNFSMSLFSGVQNNGTYSRVYTPSTDGVYNFTFFAIDGSGNIRSLVSNLTYSESTFIPPSGGGGGGIMEAGKKVCNIMLSDKEVYIQGADTFTLQVFNNHTDSYSPSVAFSDEIKSLKYTLPQTTIPAGSYGEVNIINDNAALSVTGVITLTSSNCEDIKVSVGVNEKPAGEPFFSKRLFNIGTLEVTNTYVSGLGLLLGGVLAFARRKIAPGTKVFIVLATATAIVAIFNFIF